MFIGTLVTLYGSHLGRVNYRALVTVLSISVSGKLFSKQKMELG